MATWLLTFVIAIASHVRKSQIEWCKLIVMNNVAACYIPMDYHAHACEAPKFERVITSHRMAPFANLLAF